MEQIGILMNDHPAQRCTNKCLCHRRSNCIEMSYFTSRCDEEACLLRLQQVLLWSIHVVLCRMFRSLLQSDIAAVTAIPTRTR